MEGGDSSVSVSVYEIIKMDIRKKCEFVHCVSAERVYSRTRLKRTLKRDLIYVIGGTIWNGIFWVRRQRRQIFFDVGCCGEELQNS